MAKKKTTEEGTEFLLVIEPRKKTFPPRRISNKINNRRVNAMDYIIINTGGGGDLTLSYGMNPLKTFLFTGSD